VTWEENDSVNALKELAGEEPLVIQMSMYGGFEQVGPIGQDIVSDDARITTEAGDIVLYSSDQIVVFHGSNSWAYTRLGHITDKNAEEMSELLSNGDVVITVSYE
jgi:hypothetical protein